MLTDEMKRLTEDIVALHDARVNFVETMIKDTAEMLGTFRSDHNQMSKELRAKLETEYADLLAAVDNFMKETHANNQQLREETLNMLADNEATRQADAKVQKENLIQFSNDLVKNTANMLMEFGNAHAEMAEELRSFLNASESTRKEDFDAMMNDIQNRIAELKSYTEELLRDASKAHAEMAKELRSMLETLTKERKNEVAQFMDELAKAHEAMAKELDEFLANSESTRKEDFTDMMSSITTRLAELNASTNSLLKEYAEDREGMSAAWNALAKTMSARKSMGMEAVKKIEEKDSILAAVSLAKDGGIKLTKIGKNMGKTWQSLIPIANELITEGKLTKDDDGFYHTA